MTRGRRLLIAVLQRTSAREVAARCRVSASCVSLWAAGYKRPRTSSRAKLRDLYGIPPEAWDRLVGQVLAASR